MRSGHGWRRTWQIMLVIFFISAAFGCKKQEQAGEEAAPESSAEAEEPEAEAEAARVPQDMGPPAPAIYFTAGLKGYTEPCGCSVDVLLGGIDRLTAFVQDAKALHEEAIFIDAGDWLFEFAVLEEHMVPQERAKAEVLAAAHAKMGTLFSVPGPRDLAQGPEFYLQMMEAAQMEVLAANLKLRGEEFRGTWRVEFAGEEAAFFIGALEPALFEEVEGARVSDDQAAIAEAIKEAKPGEAVILVYQGEIARAKELVEAIEGIDFVIIGHDPREQTNPEAVNGSYLLDTYDQGRYVGRLKLYGTAGQGPFVDGRAASLEERQALQTQIDHVEQNLRILELRTKGEANQMTRRLEERLAGLEEQVMGLEEEGIELPEGRQAFLFDSLAMEPEYRLDPQMERRRKEFNQSLAELNKGVIREVIPPAPGEPTYIGTAQCATCHGEAHAFWETTAHSSAMETLVERDKDFDQSCVGCHVVGWEQPGGSMLGNLVYEEEIQGQVFEKDLRDVGCESCHGPGSEHRRMPLDEAGMPHAILTSPTQEQCAQCHVPEHSPRFDFDVYVHEITGPGHRYKSAESPAN